MLNFVILAVNLYAQTFPICVDSSNQTMPSVCACSSKYIVSWLDSCVNYGQIISFEGALEKPKFLIGSSSLYTTLSSGSNNNRFLATNEAWDKGYFISSSQAIIVDSTEEWRFYVSSPVSKTACWAGSPDSGEKYFVVIYSAYGQDKNKLFGFFLSPYGEITDTFTISSYVSNPMEMNVAFNATDYLVVWKDKRTGNYDIYGQRVSRNKEPVGAEIHIITSSVDESSPKIASDGTNWLVVGNSPYGIYSRIVESDGELGYMDTLQGTLPSVTFCNNVYIIASGIGNALALRRISPAGIFIDSTLISTESPIYNTAICSQEDNCFVAFNIFNFEKQNSDLYGAVIKIGIEENNLQRQEVLQVIPNPFYCSTKLIGYSGKQGVPPKRDGSGTSCTRLTIEIYDILGRKQQCKISSDGVFGNELQKGIYFITSPPNLPIKIIKLR